MSNPTKHILWCGNRAYDNRANWESEDLFVNDCNFDDYDTIVLHFSESNEEINSISRLRPAVHAYPIALFNNNGDFIGATVRGVKGITRVTSNSFRLANSDGAHWCAVELTRIIGLRYRSLQSTV